MPILTVSQLNRQVKNFLENEIGVIQVEGEISNLSKPTSGHFYFTLKDDAAQIRCVFFKNRQSLSLSAQLANGQHVVAIGRLSLYEARGDYQLIVEQLTEAGVGELYRQFEELKNKLASEGLFNSNRKKTLPPIPQTIGIITSTSGAAIQDILSTLARRFPVANILIYPSEVQGASAAQQLIKALDFANRQKQCDVLILARGGGSMEDLWAFNNEQLARGIASSLIPIVSGIGHETDFTIADFVADYRAETPTAAAAAVTPDRLELLNTVQSYHARLTQAMAQKIHTLSATMNHLIEKISSPTQTIFSHWQKIDYLERHLISCIGRLISVKKHELHALLTQLHIENPKVQIQQTQGILNQLKIQLLSQIKNKLNLSKNQLNANLFTLHAVSPLATLDRGYAIATKNKKILHDSHSLTIGDTIEVQLAKGQLHCEVLQIKE